MIKKIFMLFMVCIIFLGTSAFSFSDGSYGGRKAKSAVGFGVEALYFEKVVVQESKTKKDKPQTVVTEVTVDMPIPVQSVEATVSPVFVPMDKCDSYNLRVRVPEAPVPQQCQ